MEETSMQLVEIVPAHTRHHLSRDRLGLQSLVDLPRQHVLLFLELIEELLVERRGVVDLARDQIDRSLVQSKSRLLFIRRFKVVVRQRDSCQTRTALSL